MEEDTAFWGRQLAGTGSYCPLPTTGPPDGPNPCEGKKPDLPNVACVIGQVNEQSGENVTLGYQGNLHVDYDPIIEPFWKVGLCPVNVHWHLGAEHYSVGQFDENGTGPEYDPALDGTDDIEERRRLAEDDIEARRRLVRAMLSGDIEERRRLAEGMRLGFQCKHYDENDPKFTTPYDWQYCINMTVGQTYEVHWPHSAAGACSTPNQYQTPFYDGVFCVDGVLNDTAHQIGVQSQVFTIVNDESYYWPDLMRGMIVEGDMGTDVDHYTGSTTGTTVNDTVCSQFSPITWHVDRKCHLVSASSFDKMCADMIAQRDDMSDDLHPHGSRDLVPDDFAADDHQRHRG